MLAGTPGFQPQELLCAEYVRVERDVYALLADTTFGHVETTKTCNRVAKWARNVQSTKW